MIDLDELHRRVPIADGHADTLMWGRDLNEASEKGHVDFPRLRQAGVKIQAFTVVTRGLPVIGGFPLLMAKEKWPKAARQSEWTRCLHQLDKLDLACANSKGTAAKTNSGDALTKNLEEGRLSAILGIEGAHAIEGDVNRVKLLAERGVRFMSLTHLANNELGGTTTPLMGNRPLTPLGRQVLDAMAAQNMVIDVAHASHAMLPDLLAHPGIRPFCSHAGIDGATPHWRNLSDATLRAIAEKGGVVGVIFAPAFLGGKSLADLARHVVHALKVMGEDGVALGSDFDGLIPLPQGMRDVRDLRLVTQALLDASLPVRVVEKVMGHNFRRFWAEVLS